MEHGPTQPSNQQPAPVVHSSWSFRYILPALFIGILAGVAGVIFYQGHLPEITNALYISSWVIFGLVIITFVIFWGLKTYLTRFIFGGKTSIGTDILEDVQRVSDAVTERVADRLLVDLPDAEKGRIKNILPRLANWFFWSRLRNWWWQWILGLFVALGGITGTMLLMNQNQLLESQNDLIKRQMSLEEANRRSALIVLMSNIMDKVDDEIKEQKTALLEKGMSKIVVDTLKYSLSQSLIGQIAALSHSFKPYRYMQGDSLIRIPLSPERGQLLFTISLLPLDTSTFQNIYKTATFKNADLKSARLSNRYMTKVDLAGANLERANLTGTDFSAANFTGADLAVADLGGANLKGAILDEAELTDAILYKADLSGAKMGRANLLDAVLAEAIMVEANFGYANLRKAILIDANLRLADFWRADLSGADLSGSDLSMASLGSANLKGTLLMWVDFAGAYLRVETVSEARSLYHSKGIQDSIKTVLHKTHSKLFEMQPELMHQPSFSRGNFK